MKRMAAILIALCLSALCAGAITIYVPGDYPTIQVAVNAAVEGDSIVIAPGEYDGLYCTSGPSDLTLIGAGGFVNNPTIVHKSPINPDGHCLYLANVSGWEIAHLTLMQPDPNGGGTIVSYNCNNLWFHHLDVAELVPGVGCGLALEGDSGDLVERCLIRASQYDALTCWYQSNSNITFQNNTIAGTDANGIINRAPVTNWVIRNCLVFDNADDGFEIDYWTPTTSILYNDSWGNYGSNYFGFTPGPTNLSVNPQLVGGTGWQAYTLSPNSPCIDAGDPASPLDPDGTIADIGCFYFNQNISQGQLILELDAGYPPPIIPMQGGSFDYAAWLHCDSTNYALFDAWTELLLPNGYVMGPLFIRPNIFLPAGGSIFRNLSFYVSAWAMPGFYEFRGYLGDSPDSVYASDWFSFLKESGDGGMTGPGQAYVTLSGWGETETVYLPVGEIALPDQLELSCMPNPFNPASAISYQLSADSYVALRVYDITGRLVETLVDGWRSAGTHELSWEAGDLPSGMYLAVLEAGGAKSVQKMMLVK